MRLLSDRRGQIRVIEAFFAAMLMLSSLSLIPIVTNHASDSSGVLTSKALNTLIILDSDGRLGLLVDERNWTAIQACLEAVLPPTLWFNLTIYDEQLQLLNTVPITTGTQTSNNIAAVDYICASINANYQLYTLRLQLAELD